FEPYAIIAKGDSGYAEVHLQPDKTPGEIKLRPWTRVEGRLWQAGKPVPEARIFLTPLRPRIAGAPDIEDRMGALTAAEGHFVFERAAPIKCSVSAWLTPWEKFPITSSQSVPLDLKPGQQVTLNLGGEGTTIIGGVALRGQEAGDFDLNWSLNYLLRKAPG